MFCTSIVTPTIRSGLSCYRYNSLNYAYPSFVTERVYNEHFLAFYVVEMLVVVCWGHVTLAYDTFIVSMCIAVSYQLRTIADSYSRLTRPEPGGQWKNRIRIIVSLLMSPTKKWRYLSILHSPATTTKKKKIINVPKSKKSQSVRIVCEN